jgi:hypothetical protein
VHLGVCLETIPDFKKVPSEKILGNGLRIDPNSFPYGREMRRGEQADLEAGVEVAQDRVAKSRCRAFSLCSGDVYHI